MSLFAITKSSYANEEGGAYLILWIHECSSTIARECDWYGFIGANITSRMDVSLGQFLLPIFNNYISTFAMGYIMREKL